MIEYHEKKNKQQRYTQNYRLSWKEQPKTAIHSELQIAMERTTNTSDTLRITDYHGKNNQQQRYTQNYRLPWKEQQTTALHS